ncbi:PspC domain-containing protein [Actinomyces oris]|uniref:PspC domain-containing protein n=1 Tax=Actinomyces oris TaxID=544580 RepID=A0AAE4K3A7_9ACTO|nr:PspC domain-containing protein [Actinomyces oris]MDT0248843.1 PspC domain-containing protein [Actinomyces oris]
MTQQQYPGQFSHSTRSEGEGASSGRSGEFFRFRDSLPRRSREHRILGGVCGGLAEAWNMPVTVVRIGVILASFLPGPMFLVYIAAWCLMLDEPAPAQY